MYYIQNSYTICYTGKTRATEAAAAAISSPLLDFPIENAKGVVFNIVGGNDLTLQEVCVYCVYVYYIIVYYCMTYTNMCVYIVLHV